MIVVTDYSHSRAHDIGSPRAEVQDDFTGEECVSVGTHGYLAETIWPLERVQRLLESLEAIIDVGQTSFCYRRRVNRISLGRPFYVSMR